MSAESPFTTRLRAMQTFPPLLKEGRQLGSMGMEGTLQYLLYLYGYEAACGGFEPHLGSKNGGP